MEIWIFSISTKVSPVLVISTAPWTQMVPIESFQIWAATWVTSAFTFSASLSVASSFPRVISSSAVVSSLIISVRLNTSSGSGIGYVASFHSPSISTSLTL